MLVIISGVSGVGKNTIINHLLKTGEYELLPTYTTRPPRGNECSGNPYYFLTDQEFNSKIEEDDFVEHQMIHGYQYGVSKSLLQARLQLGKILVKDIDVLGKQALINSLKEETKIISIYVSVSSKTVLESRLKERGEPEDAIRKRLDRFDLEEGQRTTYDYQISNDCNDNGMSASKQIHSILHNLTSNDVFYKSELDQTS